MPAESFGPYFIVAPGKDPGRLARFYALPTAFTFTVPEVDVAPGELQPLARVITPNLVDRVGVWVAAIINPPAVPFILETQVRMSATVGSRVTFPHTSVAKNTATFGSDPFFQQASGVRGIATTLWGRTTGVGATTLRVEFILIGNSSGCCTPTVIQ